MLCDVSAQEERLPQPRSRWPYISLIPIGLGAWAPIYAGVKARRGSWVLLGVLWSAIVLAGFIKNSISHAGHLGEDEVAGLLLIVGWVGAVATSFMIRHAYEQQIGSPLLAATEAGRLRLHDRRRARQIAEQNPALAREIGIGRPDRQGAVDAGLVDINNASAGALMRLPGIDDQLATRIAEVRAQTGGFSSLEDLGALLDLDGNLVEGLRGHAVFLPRDLPAGAATD
jgi:Helix-hairpin-helix motif